MSRLLRSCLNVRNRMLFIVCCLTFVTFGSGCRNCSERMCNAIRMLRTQCVVMSNACCEFPDSEGCGPELNARFAGMMALINTADIACRESNLDDLRDVWSELKRLVPINILRSLCLIYLDLDDWLARECHRYVNSTALLSPEDTMEVDIGLQEIPMHSLHRFVAGELTGSAADRSADRTFLITPGSEVRADTWMGASRLEATGVLAMREFMPTIGGALHSTPTRFSLDLIDTVSRVSVSLELSPDHEGLVLIDDTGHGMLGLPVVVDVRSTDDPDWSLEGFADVAWIELPISIDHRSMQLGGSGTLSGLDIAPVDPTLRRLLETAEDDVPPGPLAQYDPCALRIGPNGAPWPLRTLDWYWQITTTHPECFGTEG